MTVVTTHGSASVKALRALSLVMVLSCGAAALGGCNSSTDFFTDAYLVNQARASVGARPLGWSPALATKATDWAEHLAAMGTLSHSNLPAGAPAGWQELGENVGYARTVTEVHTGFLDSPEHRQNMLNPKWRVMGIGAVRAGGQVWVVEEYEY